MDMFTMRKKDFKKIPLRTKETNLSDIYSLVIIKTKRMHDSGYLCMDFVALDSKGKPICRISGMSDVLHINGIGGYGDFKNGVPEAIKPISWKTDCLPCGYLRLFTGKRLKVSRYAISDFRVYEADN